jgi:hypothetical protein
VVLISAIGGGGGHPHGGSTSGPAGTPPGAVSTHQTSPQTGGKIVPSRPLVAGGPVASIADCPKHPAWQPSLPPGAKVSVSLMPANRIEPGDPPGNLCDYKVVYP